jgi:WD40 repeat protein
LDNPRSYVEPANATDSFNSDAALETATPAIASDILWLGPSRVLTGGGSILSLDLVPVSLMDDISQSISETKGRLSELTKGMLHALRDLTDFELISSEALKDSSPERSSRISDAQTKLSGAKENYAKFGQEIKAVQLLIASPPLVCRLPILTPPTARGAAGISLGKIAFRALGTGSFRAHDGPICSLKGYNGTVASLGADQRVYIWAMARSAIEVQKTLKSDPEQSAIQFSESTVVEHDFYDIRIWALGRHERMNHWPSIDWKGASQLTHSIIVPRIKAAAGKRNSEIASENDYMITAGRGGREVAVWCLPDRVQGALLTAKLVASYEKHSRAVSALGCGPMYDNHKGDHEVSELIDESKVKISADYAWVPIGNTSPLIASGDEDGFVHVWYIRREVNGIKIINVASWQHHASAVCSLSFVTMSHNDFLKTAHDENVGTLADPAPLDPIFSSSKRRGAPDMTALELRSAAESKLWKLGFKASAIPQRMQRTSGTLHLIIASCDACGNVVLVEVPTLDRRIHTPFQVIRSFYPRFFPFT